MLQNRHFVKLKTQISQLRHSLDQNDPSVSFRYLVNNVQAINEIPVAKKSEKISEIYKGIKVDVRRQNSTVIKNVNLGILNKLLNIFLCWIQKLCLGEEYKDFLVTKYPDFQRKLVSVPESFEYKVKTQGIPDRANKRLKEYNGNDKNNFHTWCNHVKGDYAEQVIFDLLQKRFADEPCLLVNGLRESDLFKVVKENQKKNTKHSPEVKHYVLILIKVLGFLNKYHIQENPSIKKLLEHTNSNQEYDIFLFLKVTII